MVSRGIYYNEFDPFAAEWLRGLIKAGAIQEGTVDERDIREVKPGELEGLRRAHFFAGIGGWEEALRIAGWGDEPVWTASCPCQPFSSAGKRQGVEDERHLWPTFCRLVSECRPPTIFGEQVASKDGRLWLSGVRSDLEALGYSVGASDLCAAGAGSPQIRQRLFWVAERRDLGRSQGERHLRGRESDPQGGGEADGLEYSEGNGREQRRAESGGGSVDAGREPRGMADADGDEPGSRRGNNEKVRGISEAEREPGHSSPISRGGGAVRGLADDQRPGRGAERGGRPDREEEAGTSGEPSRHGAWSDSVAVPCTDGSARRTGRGVFPLAYGIPKGMGRGQPEVRRMVRSASQNRRGRLKGYGNAISPSLAAEFVMAYMEARDYAG